MRSTVYYFLLTSYWLTIAAAIAAFVSIAFKP